MNKAVLGVYPVRKGIGWAMGFRCEACSATTTWAGILSPFLLLDYAGPAQFAPAARPRGVGEHPHRGFETVTIVYQGEVAHRDSVGNSAA